MCERKLENSFIICNTDLAPFLILAAEPLTFIEYSSSSNSVSNSGWDETVHVHPRIIHKFQLAVKAKPAFVM